MDYADNGTYYGEYAMSRLYEGQIYIQMMRD
jgi:hypothetical protein